MITAKDNIIDCIFLGWFASIICLGPNLISKVFIPPTLRLLFCCFFIIIFVLISTKAIKVNKVQLSLLTKLLFLGFAFYIIGLFAGSILDVASGFSLRSLVSQSGRFVVFALVFYTSRSKMISKYMSLYTNILACFAFFSVILYILVITNDISPVSTFTNVAAGGLRERDYQNYIIGLLEANIRANDTVLPRASSFYDEPGTFAMMLMPALYWSVFVDQSVKKILILLSAILLSFSVGAWIALSICFLLFLTPFFTKKIAKILTIRKIQISKRKIRQYFAFFIVFLLSLTGIFFFITSSSSIESHNWIIDYTTRKVQDVSLTSGGGGPISRRIEDIYWSVRVLVKYPLGLGANNQIQEQIKNFSVGIAGNIVRAGFLGFLSQILIYSSLLAMIILSIFSVRRWTFEESQLTSLSLSILSFMIMSFQRIGFLSFFTGVFICALFVKRYSMNSASRNNTL